MSDTEDDTSNESDVFPTQGFQPKHRHHRRTGSDGSTRFAFHLLEEDKNVRHTFHGHRTKVHHHSNHGDHHRHHHSNHGNHHGHRQTTPRSHHSNHNGSHHGHNHHYHASKDAKRSTYKEKEDNMLPPDPSASTPIMGNSEFLNELKTENEPLIDNKVFKYTDDDINDDDETSYSSHGEHILFYPFWEEFFEKYFYNPDEPEFTTLQSSMWSLIIGISMGVFTAIWNILVEASIEFVWVTVPEMLLEYGIFTDLDGHLPLPHYMWICPAVFGGVLAFISEAYPNNIPGQDQWIQDIHRKGRTDDETLFPIFLISTAGMASGLSLGPELPLVMTAGMAGSFFAKITRQSLLSSRVLNLAAASAAIGGFFGFPMAGALFVLELPHKMGLQYFEALNPSIIASIAAVIVNRMVVQNDVKGYFNYPFLTDTLPSHIFYIAVVYGLVGSAFGIFYTEGCKFLKAQVHDLFHYHPPHPPHAEDESEASSQYSPSVHQKLTLPTKGSKRVMQTKSRNFFDTLLSCQIKNDVLRMTIIGVLAGAVVGVICMFLPIVLFWGEAQLQTLIDNGTTPLPVFGRDDEPTADLTAYGYCMPNEDLHGSFSAGCSALFVVTKVIAIGLSLGTGIIGGHFWGPLWLGAAGANLFLSLMNQFTEYFGFGSVLTMYPCLAVICMMGASHVTTFKAHMAIMLILTLTISSFTPDGSSLNTGGDYSAIFPLLVVSCYISLLATRDFAFYKKQNNRGDLIVTEQTLCEPGQYGKPKPLDWSTSYDTGRSGSFSDSLSKSSSEEGLDAFQLNLKREREKHEKPTFTVPSHVTTEGIERDFEETHNRIFGSLVGKDDMSDKYSQGDDSLDPELGHPLKFPTSQNKAMHRRTHSDFSRSDRPRLNEMNSISSRSLRSKPRSNSTNERPPSIKNHERNRSFGEITDKEMQPTLLDQARQRAASSVSKDGSDSKSSRQKIPPTLKLHHRRRSSQGSGSILSSQIMGEAGGSLPSEDVERAYSSVINQINLAN